MHPRTYYALPIAATLLVAIAFGEAYRESRHDLSVLRWLAQVPHATLASPAEGPALYRGELFGPEARTTTTGQRAAATWWWVQSTDDDSTTVHCFSRERDGLTLRDGARAVPLDFFGSDDDDVALLADDRQDTGRAVVDLGHLTRTVSDKFPGAVARCAGEKRKTYERSIPAGATVEVVACFQGGVLGPCQGPLRGLVSVGSARTHRARLAEEVHGLAHNAGIVSIAAILLATVLIARLGRRTAPISQAEKVS